LYQVSSFVIMRRLYDLKVYSYQQFSLMYQQQLEKIQTLESKSKQGGGDFFRSLNMKVNRHFLEALVSSTLEGKTLFRDAFRLLSIKNPETFYKIANQLQEG